MTQQQDGDEKRSQGPVPGVPPTTLRQALIKVCWSCIWLLYLIGPVLEMLHGEYSVAGDILGWSSLALFVGCYIVLVFRHMMRLTSTPQLTVLLGAMTVLAIGCVLLLSNTWLAMFIYVSVSAGAALPIAHAKLVIPALTGVLVACGLSTNAPAEDLFSLFLPCLLAGFAMTGMRRLIRTLWELQEARETITHLAASEERLRLARDLHDLLGHSLSLITMKSELAGRLLPERVDDAAQQVGDIERVSRQALVDVREAVSGYRCPTLGTEAASARTSLRAAGIDAEVNSTVDNSDSRLSPEEEGALAWALREAVTNVVRHSDATRCHVDLAEELDQDGARLALTVTDDGRGGSDTTGNGLSGLRERLLLVNGELRTGPLPRSGYRLRCHVPLRIAAGPTGASIAEPGEPVQG